MLKLERSDNNRRISIRMREKERFFNKVFLTALAIAIALHFLPLTLFTITPFRLGYTPREIPPVTVSAEMATGDTLVKTSAEEAGPSARHLGLLLPSNTPHLLPTTTQPLPITYAPLAIHLSGPLAELTLLPNDNLTQALTLQTVEGTPPHRHRVVYHVRVDGEQGTLFWYEPLTLSSNKKINILAENLLAVLHFQPNQKERIQSGEVEFIFTLHNNDKEFKLLNRKSL